MYNIKKRFAKDMSTDIISLIEENKKLKEKIKNLEEDNKLLNEQVIILKGLIEKSNICVTPPLSPKNIKKNKSKEKEDSEKILEYSNNLPKCLINDSILKDNINIPFNKNKENTKINVSSGDFNSKKFQENIGKSIESNISAESNKTKDRNYSRKSDRSLPVDERFPIKIYKGIGNNFVHQLIAAETSLKIKYRHEVTCATKNDKNNINVNEILDYIKSQGNVSSQEQTRLRRKFIRCYNIYEKYGEKLNTLKFSLYNLGYMTDSEYKLWLEYLEKTISELPKNCNYIYRKGDRKGEVCGTLGCKQHKVTH